MCRRSPGAGPVPGHPTLGRDSVMPAGACQLRRTRLSNKCSGVFQLKRGPVTPRRCPLPTFAVVLSGAACCWSSQLKNEQNSSWPLPRLPPRVPVPGAPVPAVPPPWSPEPVRHRLPPQAASTLSTRASSPPGALTSVVSASSLCPQTRWAGKWSSCCVLISPKLASKTWTSSRPRCVWPTTCLTRCLPASRTVVLPWLGLCCHPACYSCTCRAPCGVRQSGKSVARGAAADDALL